MGRKSFIIIDGNSVIHRAYHALPRLTNKKGEAVGAVYGFILALFKAINDFKPEYVAVCFDMPEPTFRHAEFKEYKAKRPPTPGDLVEQLKRIRNVLEGMGVTFFEKPGFEADDLIATVIKLAREDGNGREFDAFVLTGDYDGLQLVNGNTKMYILNKGVKNSSIFDREKITEKFGVEPAQIIDLKSLAGDASDNIPGAAGIGKKTAAELLQKYGSIEKIYEMIEKNPGSFSFGSAARSKKIKDILAANKEKILFFKRLVKMQDDAPVDFSFDGCRFKGFDKEKTETVLLGLGFSSLLKRIPQKNDSGLQTLF